MYQYALKLLTALGLGLLACAQAHAQARDSVKSSSIPIVDATLAKDSTVASDTLSAAQKALRDFENRYRQLKKTEVERKALFSYHDTLVACFSSPRLNNARR
jgi:hypothetical protein